MDVSMFSAKRYDRDSFDAVNGDRHRPPHLDRRLAAATAGLAQPGSAVCAFVNDDLSAPVLEALAARDVRVIALRSAGFTHVDLPAAAAAGITVVRVPAYS